MYAFGELGRLKCIKLYKDWFTRHDSTIRHPVRKVQRLTGKGFKNYEQGDGAFKNLHIFWYIIVNSNAMLQLKVSLNCRIEL